MFIKHQKIHLAGIFTGILVSYLYNFVTIFFLYELLPKNSLTEFSTEELVQLIHGLSWFIMIILFVYSSIMLNYGLKWGYISIKISNKLFKTILPNIFLYVFFSILSYIIFKYLPKNDENYSILFFMGKFILAEIIALFTVSFLNANETEKRNKDAITRLEIENKKAELNSLKEQISPHFLFNTLNTLTSIIRTEEKSQSIEFVENLSTVYRYIIDNQSLDISKLRDELTFVASYIFLLEKRFGDGIKIYVNLPTKIKDHLIPTFTIQMLIENAIKHNIFTIKSPLQIRIELVGDYIKIKNNLNPKHATESFGIGLVNLNKRFELIVGEEIKITKTEVSYSVIIPLIKQ